MRCKAKINGAIQTALSPRFVPNDIFQVAEIPRTLSGKKQELPIKKLLLGQPIEKVVNKDAMANPGCLDWYVDLARKRAGGRRSVSGYSFLANSTQVAAHPFVLHQRVEVGRLRDDALLHEDEALAALAQDVEVVRLVGVQAQEHQLAARARSCRKKSSMKPM